MKNKILVLLTFVLITITKLQAQVYAVDDYYTVQTYADSNIQFNASVAANDFDSLGGILNFSLIGGASGTANGYAIMGSNGAFSYNPDLAFYGIDSFAYIVCNNSIPADCDSGTVYINVLPCQISNTISSTNAACGQCNGTASVIVSSGTPPFLYSWSGLNSFSPVVSNLCVGIYTLIIVDQDNCHSVDTVTISNGGTLDLVIDSVKNIKCVSGSSGSVATHATGGTPPYTYKLDGNLSGASVSGLSAGIHIISVTDSNGCQIFKSFTISYSNNIYLSVNSHLSNCQTNGTASVYAQGGHPPYTYLWSDSTHQTTSTASLHSGNYTVKVTDSLGCFKSASVTITHQCLNIIKGKVFNDLNGNCVQDSGEYGIPGKTVYATPNNQYSYTDANGDYTINTYSLNNTVTVPNYSYSCAGTSAICPIGGSININFAQVGDTSANNNFAFASNNGIFDLDLHPGWTSANPGFTKKYWTLYSNIGLTSQNVVIRFFYDSLLVFNSCTQGGVHFPTQHKIEWTINNLAPGSYWNWLTKPEAYFTVPANASTSSQLCSYFEITPIAGDCNPSNNILSICEPITGSRDPNSKSVIPAGQGASGNILTSDSLLFYTIHFQNTGNDTAFTVIVSDTLSQFLDPATIVPGAASHPYTFDLSGQGILTFRFDHILLPDSNVNEPASNGYFNYTIRQKQNNPIGSVIENKAYIYFDFNEAVITNTVVNTIVTSVGVKENVNANNAVQVFPNPFNDKTTFVIQLQESNQTYSFELENVMGEKLKTLDKITEKQFSISRNGMANGIYFYKIYSAKGVVAIGKLVVE